MAGAQVQTDTGKPRQMPGAVLKQARERLGLAQKEIAAQLNLQPDTIDALESDDSQRLPTAAYVRGYLRSYARIVKLDADMLIELYNQGSIPPPEIIPNIKKPPQASSRDKPVRAITYLVTFTLALLLLAWLQSKYNVGTKPDDNVSIGTADERLYPLEQPTAPQPESSTATGSDQAQGPAAPAGPLSLPPGGAEVTESIITETEAMDVPVIETSPPGDIHLDPAQIAEDLTASADKLQFLVSRDSWIEVRDANESLLYRGLVKTGDEVNLSGKAPFAVVLGYAPGVQVRFNDAPFDPGPYTNAGIARFTLGPAD